MREAIFEEEDEEVQEDRILQAVKHVKEACKQRQLVNCK
jgi:DNA-binding protein YbaB